MPERGMLNRSLMEGSLMVLETLIMSEFEKDRRFTDCSFYMSYDDDMRMWLRVTFRDLPPEVLQNQGVAVVVDPRLAAMNDRDRLVLIDGMKALVAARLDRLWRVAPVI